MLFLDINTFFSPKAGGIRTYHQAKIAWFKQHPELKYLLVFPGPIRKEHKDGNVSLCEFHGPALTQDPAGYRLLLDFVKIYKLIKRVQPDVIEAGDAWLTGIFCLLIKKCGLYQGLLVSFYHSDPVPSYFEPWAQRGWLHPVKKVLVPLAGAAFYWLQSKYDLTAVSSKTMEVRLRAKGIETVAHLPFGVDRRFLSDTSLPMQKAGPEDGGEIRLLYAGRLDPEKGIELLLAVMGTVLQQGNVRVTVVGRGSQVERFKSFHHARFEYLGFIEDPRRMQEIYDAHHILLAPGPYETFGLGVLEGMARGLVVVGPDQGGTAELLIQAQSPFLFKSGDALDFLRAVDKAIGCNFATEIARSCALAHEYGTWDDAIGRMIACYSALTRLGSRPKPGMSPL